jgi:anti-sigma B factor antagonist
VDELAQIAIEQHGDVAVARVAGEIDISNIAPARRELAAGVPDTACGLVVDLTDTSYLDSSGVYLLFELQKSLQRRSKHICVVAPSRAPSTRVLFITGFDKVMPFTETVEEGLAQVRSEAGTARPPGA